MRLRFHILYGNLLHPRRDLHLKYMSELNLQAALLKKNNTRLWQIYSALSACILWSCLRLLGNVTSAGVAWEDNKYVNIYENMQEMFIHQPSTKFKEIYR